MNEFQILRPWFLLALLPLCILIILSIAKNTIQKGTWSKVIDAHLLPHLLIDLGKKDKRLSLFCLFSSLFLIILSSSGPTWSKKEVPIYKPIKPYVILLDMSDDMISADFNPNRLKRAKFKLHELFKHSDAGQFAMIAYTSEPFVVSPLTEDSETIDALLNALTEDVMPVGGNKLDLALLEAQKLIEQAKFKEGNILVLSASPPSQEALKAAQALQLNNIKSSIMPILVENIDDAFKLFAKAGNGELISFTDDKKDIEKWLLLTQGQMAFSKKTNTVEIWQDEGRWFLLPALFFLMPVFRKNWLDKITT